MNPATGPASTHPDLLMASHALSSSVPQHRHSKTSRAYARRWVVKDHRDGWWPFGWLPLVAFILICLIGFVYFAPARIESQVANEVSRQLTKAGYPWAKVTANGQEVIIHGTPSSAISETQLTAVARATECETGLGKLVCPTVVRVQLDTPAAPAAAPPPKPRFFDFRFERQLNAVSLRGEVPSVEVQQALETQAKQHFATVDSDLEVSSAVSEPGYALAFRRGLSVLRQLESGHASYTSGVLDIEGVITRDNEAEARRIFSSASDAPLLGSLQLDVSAAPNHCNEEFASVLKKTSIRFATASAVIHASSRRVLKALAQIAHRCPGKLRIEGHTDSAGEPEANQELSLDRANAVKTALTKFDVDGTRLLTEGFGALQPLAPNHTRSGRARNRRIEIRMERASTEASRSSNSFDPELVRNK